jgi:hypothetical protein
MATALRTLVRFCPSDSAVRQTPASGFEKASTHQRHGVLAGVTAAVHLTFASHLGTRPPLKTSLQQAW